MKIRKERLMIYGDQSIVFSFFLIKCWEIVQAIKIARLFLICPFHRQISFQWKTFLLVQILFKKQLFLIRTSQLQISCFFLCFTWFKITDFLLYSNAFHIQLFYIIFIQWMRFNIFIWKRKKSFVKCLSPFDNQFSIWFHSIFLPINCGRCYTCVGMSVS